MQITVTEDIERALVRQADLLGTSPEHVALDVLRERFLADASSQESKKKEVPPDAPESQETLYDFLKDFIGCIDSSEHVPGGANLSVDTGKKFSEIVLEKHRGRK